MERKLETLRSYKRATLIERSPAQGKEKIKKHPWPLLIFSLLFFGLIGYLVVNWSPHYVITLGSLKLSLLIPFFVLLFAGIYAFVAYFMISFLQGLIIAGTIIAYLLLRFFGITHPLFGILLLAMLISIEFAIYKKK